MEHWVTGLGLRCQNLCHLAMWTCLCNDLLICRGKTIPKSQGLGSLGQVTYAEELDTLVKYHEVSYQPTVLTHCVVILWG